jgi:chloride channel 7
MIAVLFAKWVGDFITHPFYHALLELKCIPFLDQDPVVVTPHGERLNLELYQAVHVMTKPVHTLRKLEKISAVAKVRVDISVKLYVFARCDLQYDV